MTQALYLHQISSTQEIYLVSVHHSILAQFTEMPELKTPQTTRNGQMGQVLQWLFPFYAWKKTQKCMTLFNFPLLSQYALLNKTQLSSRSQRLTKRRILLIGSEKQRSGHWIPGKLPPVKNILVCHLNTWQSCKYHTCTPKLICRIFLGEEFPLNKISIGH